MKRDFIRKIAMKERKDKCQKSKDYTFFIKEEGMKKKIIWISLCFILSVGGCLSRENSIQMSGEISLKECSELEKNKFKIEKELRFAHIESYEKSGISGIELRFQEKEGYPFLRNTEPGDMVVVELLNYQKIAERKKIPLKKYTPSLEADYPKNQPVGRVSIHLKGSCPNGKITPTFGGEGYISFEKFSTEVGEKVVGKLEVNIDSPRINLSNSYIKLDFSFIVERFSTLEGE